MAYLILYTFVCKTVLKLAGKRYRADDNWKRIKKPKANLHFPATNIPQIRSLKPFVRYLKLVDCESSFGKFILWKSFDISF